MAKLVWRVKLVAERHPGVTAETELACIEREAWFRIRPMLLAKSIACSFMALTATKEQLLFGKGGCRSP